jgi:hypothetical protein
MHQITIRLPSNRDYTGTLKLEDAKGKLIAGPFHVCARAHDELARANGNPDRLPVLPFGDMPLGEYEIVRVVPSGPGTPFDRNEFGSAGIVFLQPKHGEAALADANGRFIFLIHGGALARNGALRPTEDGSLRLSNRDQRRFIGTLRRVGADACRCNVTNSGSARRRVAIAAHSARSTRAPGRGDPTHSAPFAAAASASLAETSRRSWLRTVLIAAGAFATIPNLLRFFSPKAYGDGGGTDYYPKTTSQPTNEENQKSTTETSSGTTTTTEPPMVIPPTMANDPDVQNLNKYQQQLQQDQAAAAKAQADYEAQKQINPNTNMAPLLDAQAKLKGTQDMVKYETNQVEAKLPASTPPKNP